MCVCVCMWGSYRNDLGIMCISLGSVLINFVFPNMAQYVILLSEKGDSNTYIHKCAHTYSVCKYRIVSHCRPGVYFFREILDPALILDQCEFNTVKIGKVNY